MTLNILSITESDLTGFQHNFFVDSPEEDIEEPIANGFLRLQFKGAEYDIPAKLWLFQQRDIFIDGFNFIEDAIGTYASRLIGEFRSQFDWSRPMQNQSVILIVSEVVLDEFAHEPYLRGCLKTDSPVRNLNQAQVSLSDFVSKQWRNEWPYLRELNLETIKYRRRDRWEKELWTKQRYLESLRWLSL